MADSRDPDSRVMHLVLIDGTEPEVGIAADALLMGLRPLVHEFVAGTRILEAWLGRRLEPWAAGTVPRVTLLAADDFTHAVQLEFASAPDLAAYYQDPLHVALRTAFYRRLPGLADLWRRHDAARASERDALLARIDQRAADRYVRRIDLRLSPFDGGTSR